MPKVLTLPSNVEAERSVLGSMLISPEAAQIALGSLTEEDFSGEEPRNVHVFHAMRELQLHNRSIDPQTVNDELISLKLDGEVDMSYILQLVNTTIFPQNIDQYINMVHEQSVLRSLLKTFSFI